MGCLFEGFEADVEDEPEMIEYRATFSRTMSYTESCYVRFEAEEGLSESDLEEEARLEFNRGGCDWEPNNDYDWYDETLDEIEEA